MGFLLGCEKMGIDFPSKTVFDDISLGVDAGERIGIVGRNGDGKSTLINVLAGLTEPDRGRVIRTNGVSVGVLGQSDQLQDEDSVARSIVGDVPEYEWASDARVRAVIAGIAGDIPWEAPVKTLSGGQRRRVDLARLLVGDWDVLMLDEPTNHLDVRGINWLAQHLKSRWREGQGALLVVTHDRWFLDEVCTSMWEVHDRRIEPFEGGFSAYIMQRVERERQARVAEERRQNKLRRELAWLARGAQARSTKQKFRIKAAQELIADVPPLRNDLELKRMAVARLGKQVIDVMKVSVSYDFKSASEGEPCHWVLRDVEWLIGPGDRIGIVGENGAGKTTLLNVIQQKLRPTKGYVKVGKTVKFAVLSQHLDELAAAGDDRVRQVVGRFGHAVMLDGRDQTPKQLLERLGFSNADMNEPISDLSGGQRRRLALMLILLEEPNVLILDEPGNDLDVDMLAAVEDLLDGWPGTLIMVTHDRYLMERVTDNQYALIDGRLRHLPGGIDEYLAIVGEREQAISPAAALRNEEASPVSPNANTAAPSLSNAELRALKKALQSAERKMHTCESKLEDANRRLHEANPTDFQQLGSIQSEIDELRAQLEELELAWLEAAEALEA
ncbi:MAG: ABC-F family ATP-binding cassette domain-containing protein [Eggerthellaceae bacterium]|nr:ABC-F family ATP-binding cassette domain-containing protein [Eggerthellaceae bacterium]